MSDEIDIEEHDVLDNPTLKKIFPDLSILKKEILQYEEGLGSTPEETSQEDVNTTEEEEQIVYQSVDLASDALRQSNIQENPDTYINNRLEIHLRFKAFLDSLADDISENTTVKDDRFSSSHEYSDDNIPPRPVKRSKAVHSPNNNVKNSQSNIFILGSKPNLKHPIEKRQAKVVLKNVSFYLNSCKQYCKYCFILFPSIDALTSHMTKIHSLKMNDSTTKQKRPLGLKSTKIKFQCKICTITLSSKSNLARHLKMVHKYTEKDVPRNIIREKRKPLRGNSVIHKSQMLRRAKKPRETEAPVKPEISGKLNTSHNCFHCPKIFETLSSLIEHLYDVLNPNKIASAKVEQIIKNRKTKNDGNTKDHNLTVSKSYECSTCALKFSTHRKLDLHNRQCHSSNGSVAINKNNSSKENDLPELNCVLEGSNLTETIKDNASQDKSQESDNDNTNEKKNCGEEKKYSYTILKNLLIPHKNSPKNSGSAIQVNTENFVTAVSKQQKANTEKFVTAVSKQKKPNETENFISAVSKQKKLKTDNSTSSISKQKKPDTKNFVTVVNKQKRQLYQCFICSQYLTNFSSYIRHMSGHNITGVSEGDKTIFEFQCKFCPAKVITMKSYNCHISKVHQEKIKKKIELDYKAFHSILFKCTKCDIFFLSANATINHSIHDEIFSNWKCLDCHRSFKIIDKHLHKKQHVLSKNITAYALPESALNRVLYKCLKCAIHFSEKEYHFHYPSCGLQIPNSTYCNTCDILINRNDIPLHELNHKDRGLLSSDFTFIESDIIIDNEDKEIREKQLEYEEKQIDKSQNINKKKIKRSRSKFALTFCYNCKCFIGNLGRRRKSHCKGQCIVWMNPRMCRKCGLVFTPRGYLSHKMLHDTVENLSMQTFYFYDIKTKKQIQPPVPNYPCCNICEVHFINKPAIKVHECDKQHYKMCNICNIKLTDAAFKLHINYHKYKLSSSALSKKQNARLNMKALTDSNSLNSAESTVNKELSNISENNIFLYTCISCNITVDVYDKVVEHCHDHYDYCKVIQTRDDKKNKTCNKYDDEITISVKFDPFYFRFDNEVWIKHIFVNLTENQIDKILHHSIYKYECRLKMEEIQPGQSSLTLYKCDVCRFYIDPCKLYSHAENTCTTAKKHPCSHCGLCFSTPDYQMVHENLHEQSNITRTSFKITLFNKTEHQQFTKMMLDSRHKFILYQCRNCEGIVEKLLRDEHECNSELLKCSHCGLLYNKQEINLHINKHKEITNFKSEHMVIILFGKLESNKNDKLRPSFSGTIYDLTFYKCTNCGLCLKNENTLSEHFCILKSSKSQCPKCYLYFLKKELSEHLQLHDDNLELGYDDFTSNIIPFDIPTMKEKSNAIEGKNDSLKSIKNNVVKQKNTNENSDMPQKIYKCSCGLHFLEEMNARKHKNNCNTRTKSSKQSCLKCDLLFTPGELFNHLLKHHGDKKIKYKYDIINISNKGKKKSIDT